jgi:diketogulonate reductase-like aldo/keto reductase
MGVNCQSRVKDNLACMDVKLTPAQIDRLDAVSKIELGFPLDMFTKEMVRSLSSGGMRDKIDA